MNKIICSILTWQVANIGIDSTCRWASFKFLNSSEFFNFFESVRDLHARMKVANIGIDSTCIWASFKFLNSGEFFNFLKAYVTSTLAWIVIFRVLHDFSGKNLFVVRRFLPIILLHFSNLKFLVITANVLNSACFDWISFCEKFEINFWLVSSGPPVFTNFH